MTVTAEQYNAVSDIDYDDLTPEDVQIVRDYEIQSVNHAESVYNETGEVNAAFFDYVRATVTYGHVHHARLIEAKESLKTLKALGDAMKDSATAYINELETTLVEVNNDAKALADEVTELHAQIEDLKNK